MKVILASQSKARHQLLSSLGIPFAAIPARINEKGIRDADLGIQAEKIARAKAETIDAKHQGIIACDTFSESGGRVLEKPTDKNEAKEMLLYLSGKKAVNYTGFCYIDRKNDIDYSTVVTVSYSLRTLYEDEIDEYVKNFPVTEWAAGFALIHPYSVSFVASVAGSYTGLAYGLPTEILIPLLKKSGFEPNPRG